jgi:hypothetical protein
MNKRLMAIILIMLIFSMGCSISNMFNPEPDEEQGELAATLSVLQTQLAITPENEVLEKAPTITPADTPEPTPAPDFQYEYLSFNYHPSLASNVWGEVIPIEDPGEESFPVHAPEHILAHFDNFIIGDHFHTPEVRVYPIEPYREMSDVADSNIEYLNELLSTLSTTENYYPYLPFIPAGQIYIAKVAYLDFEGGRGVRYLSQFGQAVWPANNRDLFYTFQGISNNGYYISVTLPLRHSELSNNGDEYGSDWEPYYNEEAWAAYEAETEETLNGYPDVSYSPSIVLYDDIVRSIRITP